MRVEFPPELIHYKLTLKMFVYYKYEYKIKVSEKERKKERVNSAHYVLPAMPKDSTHTCLVPMFKLTLNLSCSAILILFASFSKINSKTCERFIKDSGKKLYTKING
jgi:hypothetical protein